MRGFFMRSEESMHRLQFDNKISLGHIISIASMLIAGALAYANLHATQASQHRRLERVEQSQQDREVRLRALEISTSSQAADLRNIQMGIADIKASLDKMMTRPD